MKKKEVKYLLTSNEHFKIWDVINDLNAENYEEN